MSATQASRRPASSRTTRQTSTAVKPVNPKATTSKTKLPAISADDLANQVAGLTISDTKGKHKASSNEDTRLAAMRAVNSASQRLSGIVQSGWKAGSGKKPTTAAGAVSVAVKSLKELRGMCPGDIDVERAASSIVGKLLALEMRDEALSALTEMQPALIKVYNSTNTNSQNSNNPLSLPLPCTVLTEILQQLISAYFLQVITALSSSSSLPNLLIKASTGLMEWLPHLPSLPLKHKDSILTRTYTLLTKSTITPAPSPPTAYALRTYALRCLVCTSPGTLTPNTFWDQALKFAVSFAKAGEKNEVTREAMHTFALLAKAVEERDDCAIWLEGKGFMGFCEYWMAFAKRAADLATLDRIALLMRGASPSASPSSSTAARDTPHEQTELAADALVIEGARICAVFTQTTAVIEQGTFGDELTKCVCEAISLLPRCRAILLLTIEVHVDQDAHRTRGKVERALERLRRLGVKMIDSTPDGKGRASEKELENLRSFLAGVAQVYGSLEKTTENLTPALDTLFVLARTTLVTTDYDTYTSSYDYLIQANTILGPEPALGLANYVRCVSGAHHNIAGTLYQDGRYAGAVRFLKEGCRVGGTALEMRTRQKPEEKATGAEDAWKSLREGLFRRWELLGICYSKMGDRRPAYDAFVNSVKAYPFQDSAFIVPFDNSTPAKQLGIIIDRLTHIGACELLLQPTDVSLRACLSSHGAGVLGAVLERQAESLEANLWKEGVVVVVGGLLQDLEAVYQPHEVPLRRARVLLRQLEVGYKSELDGSRNADDIGDEILELLGRESFGEDAAAAHLCSQFRASLHLWLALHAHRRSDPAQTSVVARNCEEAYRVLKALIEPTEPSSKRKTAKTTPVKTTTVVRLKAKAKAASAKRGDPVTPKPRKGLVLVALNVQTTPLKAATNAKIPAFDFDDFEKVLSLLQSVSHLLGLLGLVVVKVKLLDITRRLCERHSGTSHEGYLLASIDLAHEYVKLGKTGKASTVFGQALIAVRNGQPSDEIRTTFLLRYSESLATVSSIHRSASAYCEALALSNALAGEAQGTTTAQKVIARVCTLERAAMAAHTYGLIQYAKDDMTASLEGLFQSLRLWNRGIETLARLNPQPISVKASAESDEDPFAISSLNDALPSSDNQSSKPPELSTTKKVYARRPAMNGLEWRIVDGLLHTLFALSHAFFARGSPRESEYFAQQAQDLAESINAPAMVSRALMTKGEVQLHQGLLDDGYNNIMGAAELLESMPGADAANISRLRGYHSQLKAKHADARESYESAMGMLEELEALFAGLDCLPPGPRKSTGLSPKTAAVNETIVPALLATVLRQHIWLLRDDTGASYQRLLERFAKLPALPETKSEENVLMAKLTLHNVYGRFRADMFLSSLIESTIAMPMGVSGDKLNRLSPSIQDILTTLDNAESLFWADLTLVARRGNVSRVRDATVSLAMIRALQSSLGRAGKAGPVLTAALLDVSTAITLRRELLEAIQGKFPDAQRFDDLQWPLITSNGTPLARPKTRMQGRLALMDSFDDDGSEDDTQTDESALRQYWAGVQERYNSRPITLTDLSTSRADVLPKNWTVINITITEDQNTMFVTRQRASQQPLVFCLPLKGRRESQEDEHLTFEDALVELKAIIAESNQGTRAAVHVPKNDLQARAAWWGDRSALDKRMQELLANIEFCWLGAFKTIMSPPVDIPVDVITDLRTRLDKVFKRSLQSQDRKQRASKKIRLDDNLLTCFSTLPANCRDEELEDLVYFILDLYQFHGVPVAIAEVDVDQVVVDLRTALEEHTLKARGRVVPEADAHTFLVLDKNVQGIPWESVPVLRGQSVSRIPSLEFLLDRVELARVQKGAGVAEIVDRAEVDPRKAYYVLNPSGDLAGTEGRFSGWLREMDGLGWEGTIGRPPSEQQFLNALRRKDLVVYFGHGGGEQYVRPHKIKSLPRCAATMLWGCSSGNLRDMGDFDRVGTPYNYMLAGCPTLVANLWDVTDRDIDKFSQAVFDKLNLSVEGVRQGRRRDGANFSLVAAVAQARTSCKLKYLTGAAPVVYGIPFYL